MKIGLFGGSFNPIHKGHIALANNFVNDLKLDKLILMPANIPPHKRTKELAKGEHRLNMCRLAAKRIKNAEVSDFELCRNKISFTVDTLEELYGKYKEKIYLIMGTDMFLSLHTWRNPQRIFELSIPCVSSRNEHETQKLLSQGEFLSEKFGVKSQIKNFPVIELSSTEIREKLSDDGDLSDLIDTDILEYITQNGLYKGK